MTCELAFALVANRLTGIPSVGRCSRGGSNSRNMCAGKRSTWDVVLHEGFRSNKMKVAKKVASSTFVNATATTVEEGRGKADNRRSQAFMHDACC